MKFVHLVHGHDIQKFHDLILGLKITNNVKHQATIREARRVFDWHLWNQALAVHESKEGLDTIEHSSVPSSCDFDQFLRDIHLELVWLTGRLIWQQRGFQ